MGPVSIILEIFSCYHVRVLFKVSRLLKSLFICCFFLGMTKLNQGKKIESWVFVFVEKKFNFAEESPGQPRTRSSRPTISAL